MICYCIMNKVNKKLYFGITSKSFKTRKLDHQRMSKKKPNTILYKAFTKYGFENFEWKYIDYTGQCTFEELKEIEIYYINKYRTYVGFDDSRGYNMTLGGEGMLGFKFSEESRTKMSESHSNKKLSEEHKKNIGISVSGKKNGFYGKSHSEEFKKRMSEEKSKLYIGENNPFYGKSHSEKTKKKISKRNSVRISIDSVIYDSQTEASKKLGIRQNMISRRCYSDNFPNYKFV